MPVTVTAAWTGQAADRLRRAQSAYDDCAGLRAGVVAAMQQGAPVFRAASRGFASVRFDESLCALQQGDELALLMGAGLGEDALEIGPAALDGDVGAGGG